MNIHFHDEHQRIKPPIKVNYKRKSLETFSDLANYLKANKQIGPSQNPKFKDQEGCDIFPSELLSQYRGDQYVLCQLPSSHNRMKSNALIKRDFEALDHAPRFSNMDGVVELQKRLGVGHLTVQNLFVNCPLVLPRDFSGLGDLRSEMLRLKDQREEKKSNDVDTEKGLVDDRPAQKNTSEEISKQKSSKSDKNITIKNLPGDHKEKEKPVKKSKDLFRRKQPGASDLEKMGECFVSGSLQHFNSKPKLVNKQEENEEKSEKMVFKRDSISSRLDGSRSSKDSELVEEMNDFKGKLANNELDEMLKTSESREVEEEVPKQIKKSVEKNGDKMEIIVPKNTLRIQDPVEKYKKDFENNKKVFQANFGRAGGKKYKPPKKKKNRQIPGKKETPNHQDLEEKKQEILSKFIHYRSNTQKTDQQPEKKQNNKLEKPLGFLDTPDLVKNDGNRNRIKNRESLIQNFQETDEESYIPFEISDLMERKPEEQIYILSLFRKVKFKRIVKEGDTFKVDNEFLFGVIKRSIQKGVFVYVIVEFIDNVFGFAKEEELSFDMIYELMGLPLKEKLKELNDLEDVGFIKGKGNSLSKISEEISSVSEQLEKESLFKKNFKDSAKSFIEQTQQNMKMEEAPGPNKEIIDNSQPKQSIQQEEKKEMISFSNPLENLQKSANKTYSKPSYSSSDGKGVSSLTRKDYRIAEQINFYFSDKNYRKDEYIQSHIDSEGYLDMDLLINFPRIKSFTRSKQEVIYALKKFEEIYNATYLLNPSYSKIKKK